MSDYYALLGVAKTASAAEIRKAYAQIARDRHPDRFTDATEKERAQEFFKEATAAFNTLSSDRSRAQYDAELHRPQPKTPEEQAAAAYAEAQELLKAGDSGGAIESLRRAAYLQPSETRFRLLLGKLLARDPRGAREGVSLLEELARQAPSNVAILLELAQAFQAQGLALRARKSAEAALALQPDNAAAARLLASLKPGDSAGDKPPGGLGGFLRRKP